MVELAFAVGIVVFTSAMCSLFEAVLYSVSFSHIEALAQTGQSGQILRRLRKNVDRPITAILTLNTVSNTGGAAFAGAIAARELRDHPYLLWLFPVFFTLVILFISEVLPKTAGVVYGRSIAALIAVPLQLLVWIFAPVIWLTRLVTGLLGRGHSAHQISEDEIVMMARLGMRSGDIEADRGLVIQNILSLGSKTAHDVMTPRTVVFALESGKTVEEARTKREFLSYSRVPIYDKDLDDVVGVVHRRDVLSAMADDRHNVTLEKLMKPVHFVLESITLDRLLRMFLEGKQHMFVVLDEFGGLSGVVTLEDVLEEILGKEIVDEFDEVTDMRELAHQRRREAMKGSAKSRGS